MSGSEMYLLVNAVHLRVIISAWSTVLGPWQSQTKTATYCKTVGPNPAKSVEGAQPIHCFSADVFSIHLSIEKCQPLFNDVECRLLYVSGDVSSMATVH
ncbi:hypothetical protein XENTR_v10011696 [Xenopus tropicalis]|nr:hypothetical protein XENTR_v10011696 [Xenopus tropicalis]